MAGNRIRKRYVYGVHEDLIKVFPDPIVSQRPPTANDRAQIGQVWIDRALDDIYFLTSVAAGVSTWINAGGGGGIFTTITVDPGDITVVTGDIDVTAGDIDLANGDITIDLGNFEVTAGTATIGAFGAGVVTSDAAGLLASTAGTDGQVIIGATAAAPAWAALTAGAGINITNGANTITITATGATAVQYTTDDANVVFPDGVGNVNVVGGVNIGTTGAVANTVTINLDAAPTLAGLLTCQLGIDVSGADVHLVSATNVGQDIYLHANGGIAETIEIYSQQGTGVDSIWAHSNCGGITIDAALASADAINIVASDVAGGIDIDSGTQGVIVDTTGPVSLDAEADSNFTITGAFDLTLDSTLGSVIVDGGEAVGDAVQLTASDAAGGITAAAGTGGITLGAVNGIVAITSGTGAINVGTDAAAHVVTVGSTDTTSRTVIQSGTGDLALTSTDNITVDAGTGLFSIDSVETSNVTVTGASEDLQLYAVGGSVVIDGSEAAATAISLDASDGAGGVTIAAGTGGLLFGNQADCTTIDIGDFAPTAARTITIGGGTVVTAAVTDTIDIGPDGATTNANSIKTVNINTGGVTLGEVLTHIASGAITSGTHTVNIQTGNAAAGTVTTNVSTGTGTKTVNVGNADGLTTCNIDAITLINDSLNVATSINTGTSTGTVTIGNGAAGAIAVDTAAGISLDGATASNFTVTGAADLTLNSTAGGVDISSGEAAADCIYLHASDAAGGVTIEAGTGGLNFGNQADCTTIGIGDLAPTAARTITIGGGTVVTAAVTDTIDIGPDGATTNANSIKTVNINTGGVTLGEVLTNIASGAITSGTHTVSIQTGNAAAGTVATNISTGTGTKTVSIGNADANTTCNIDAITLINDDVNAAVSINTGTSTGAVTIGNIANAGNIALESAGTVLLDSVGVLELNSSAGVISIGNDNIAQNINLGTAGARTIAIGSNAATVTIDSGAGDITLTSTDDLVFTVTDDISLDAASIDINATGGAVSVTPGTASVAGVALTLNARVGVCTFTGQTTGAGVDLDLDITNSFVSAGIGVLVTVNNEGTNDADITIEGVNTQTAGHLILHCINSGAAALNGNVTVTFWVLN